MRPNRWLRMVAHLDRLQPRGAFAPEPFSPANCQIMYVTNAHPAESVPGAIKVNVKTECSRVVP
jgi:hypothetical protein